MERREGRRPGVPSMLTAGAMGVVAALSLAPTAAYPQEPTGGTAAPNGTASSTVVKVGEIVTISETEAEAGPETGRARAGVIYLNGQPVLGTGGEQEGAGRKEDALFDTGETPLGRLQLAPWEVEVTEGDSERTARGRSAALDLYVVDEDTVSVVLLESRSEARHSDGRSSGSSSSDGARLRIGGDLVDVTILHSEASSENGSKSYVLKVNGTEIGNDEQLGQICNLEIPNVVIVGCLQTGGGTGTDGTTTGNATVLTGDVPLPADVTVVGAESSSGQGRAAVKPVRQEREEERQDGSGAVPNAPAADTDTGALPTTGAEAAQQAGLAAAAVAFGAWLQAMGSRRRKGGATA